MRCILYRFAHRNFVAGFGFVHQIAGHGVIELRRAGRQRLFGVDDRLQLAIFNFHQLGSIGRRRCGIRYHQRHRFTDETHFAVRQHRAIQ